MTIVARLDSVFDATLPLDGVECPVRLRVPTTRFLHSLVPLPSMAHEVHPLRRETLLCVLVERLNGVPMTLAWAKELVTEPALAARVPALRDRFFEALIAEGFARPTCPVCGHEAAQRIGDLFASVRAAPRPLANAWGNLEAPALAFFEPRGRRPAGMPVASQMRFTLPSAPVGVGTLAWGGVLCALETEEGLARQARLWRQWAPWEVGPPGKVHWDPIFPGFRAVMAVTAAAPAMEGVEGTVTPEVIESLPAIDWLFLDRLYFVTRRHDVPDAAVPVECPACRHNFLPVTS